MNYVFADTANLDEIIEANDMGVIQGVTTNPSIIAKEPQGSFDDLITKLAEYCGSENLSLSVEVFAEGYDAIVKQASEIYEKFVPLCPELYVKIPVFFVVIPLPNPKHKELMKETEFKSLSTTVR